MATSQRIASLFLVAAALLGTTAKASAQCPPGVRFCGGAEFHAYRNGGARIYVQYGRPTPPVVYAPPPPVVYQAPPPPVVYQAPPPPPQVIYQAPPPPPPQVVYAPPPQQPQVVVVRPATPPPPIVYTVPQQPQTVYVRPAASQTVIVRQGPTYAPRRTQGRYGLHFSVGGAGGNGAGLGGVSGAFRLRPSEHFALDFGIGAYGGHTVAYYQDNSGAYVTSNQNRVEIPLTIDGLIFVNPQHKAQLYFVGGPGLSFASLQNAGVYSPSGSPTYSHTYTYFGGSLGGGIEFRLRPGFALNLEARGFMRHRIDSTTPEFVRSPTSSTNRSAGFLASAGLTVYF